MYDLDKQSYFKRTIEMTEDIDTAESTLPEILNPSLVETQIRLLGNKYTISLIVLLLAYIRNAINSNSECDILVKVGHIVANDKLAMDVNGQEVSDYKPQPEIDID